MGTPPRPACGWADRLLARLRERQEWKFFGVLPRADPGLAVAWWAVLVAARRAAGACSRSPWACWSARCSAGGDLAGPLAAVGVVFVLLQVLTPLHQAISANLGDRTAAWLYDRLTEACVEPPGMGHLEDPELTSDLTVARDFDLGMTGPPLSISMDFIAAGLVELVGGLAVGRGAVRVTPGGRRWCSAAPGWPPTGCCARARSGATATPTRCARPARRRLRLPAGRRPAGGQGAAPVRPGRLDDRPLRRPAAAGSTSCSTRPPGCGSGRCSGAWCWSSAANVVVFWSLADAAADGRLEPRRRWSCSPRSPSARQHDRLRRAQLGARRRGRAGGGRRCGSTPAMAPAGRAAARAPAPAEAMPAGRDPLPRPHASPTRRGDARCSTASTSTIPAGLVARDRRPERRGQDHAGQAAVPALRPAGRARSRSTASTSASSTSTRWRARVTAVFQDFIRFELPLRDNVAPAGAARRRPSLAALAEAGADGLAGLDTVLAKGYEGGTDLSGGQWQRVALARALCAVRLGAGRRAARRADRAARRARRGRDLRAHPGRHPALHDRSSSRTASRPCATPTASACSSTAGSSSSAPTTS